MIILAAVSDLDAMVQQLGYLDAFRVDYDAEFELLCKESYKPPLTPTTFHNKSPALYSPKASPVPHVVITQRLN